MAADGRHQAARDLHQHGVAGLVAERVVDALEVVEVQQHDRRRRAVAEQRLAQPDAELPPVADAGQGVGARQALQRRLRRAALGDVALGADEADHGPLGVAHGPAARDDPARQAARQQEPVLLLELDPVLHGLVPAAHDARAVVGVDAGQPAVVQRVLRREVEDRPPALVDEGDVAVQVGQVDADRCRDRQLAEDLLALTQRRLGLLDRRHVGNHAARDRHAVVAHLAAPAVVDVAHSAVRTLQPVLRRAALAAGLGRRRAVVDREIVGQDERPPDRVDVDARLRAEVGVGVDALGQGLRAPVRMVGPDVDELVDPRHGTGKQLGGPLHPYTWIRQVRPAAEGSRGSRLTSVRSSGDDDDGL